MFLAKSDLKLDRLSFGKVWKTSMDFNRLISSDEDSTIVEL